MSYKSLIILLLVIFILSACQSTTPSNEITQEGEQTELSSPIPESTEPIADNLVEPVASETAKPSPVKQPTVEKGENMEDETMETGKADADVEFVRAVLSPEGTWSFSVTVRHPDTGWEDYTNGWDVTTVDGTVLKLQASDQFTRLLLHPHENEQPFTRSQSGIVIPTGMTQVIVRAHDLVDGYGGEEVKIDLTASSGPGYEVERR